MNMFQAILPIIALLTLGARAKAIARDRNMGKQVAVAPELDFPSESIL